MAVESERQTSTVATEERRESEPARDNVAPRKAVAVYDRPERVQISPRTVAALVVILIIIAVLALFVVPALF